MATEHGSIRRQQMIGRFVIYGGLGVLALLYLMPLWVMVVTSLKTLDDVYASTFVDLPKVVTFEAWTKAWGCPRTSVWNWTWSRSCGWMPRSRPTSRERW